MKAKDVYYKIYATTDLPVGIFTYSYRDFDQNIHVDSLWINFNEAHDYNIGRMEKLEEEYKGHFMFWNNSDEAEQFWRENKVTFKHQFKTR